MHFWESYYYSQNGENGSILDLKSILLNFYLKLLNRFFWNRKSGFKWLFWIFKENSYHAQNWVNGHFRSQNQHKNFCSFCFSGFLPKERHWIVGKSVCFSALKEILIYAQNGAIGSFCGPNSIFFNLPRNQFIRLFWSCIWWKSLKSGWKWLF